MKFILQSKHIYIKYIYYVNNIYILYAMESVLFSKFFLIIFTKKIINLNYYLLKLTFCYILWSTVITNTLFVILNDMK